MHFFQLGKDDKESFHHKRQKENRLQDQFEQIEQLRQKNRERFRERLQKKTNGFVF